MKWMIGLFAVFAFAFFANAFTMADVVREYAASVEKQIDLSVFAPFATVKPCADLTSCDREPKIEVSSSGSGVATDSVKALSYWEENRPSFSSLFPRAFVQREDCKWFNTIKNECEG